MTQEERKERTKQAISKFNFDEANGFKLDRNGVCKEELKTSDIYAIDELSADKIELIANAYKLGYARATGKIKA